MRVKKSIHEGDVMLQLNSSSDTWINYKSVLKHWWSTVNKTRLSAAAMVIMVYKL